MTTKDRIRQIIWATTEAAGTRKFSKKAFCKDVVDILMTRLGYTKEECRIYSQLAAQYHAVSIDGDDKDYASKTCHVNWEWLILLEPDIYETFTIRGL